MVVKPIFQRLFVYCFPCFYRNLHLFPKFLQDFHSWLGLVLASSKMRDVHTLLFFSLVARGYFYNTLKAWSFGERTSHNERRQTLQQVFYILDQFLVESQSHFVLLWVQIYWQCFWDLSLALGASAYPIFLKVVYKFVLVSSAPCPLPSLNWILFQETFYGRGSWRQVPLLPICAFICNATNVKVFIVQEIFIIECGILSYLVFQIVFKKIDMCLASLGFCLFEHVQCIASAHLHNL